MEKSELEKILAIAREAAADAAKIMTRHRKDKSFTVSEKAAFEMVSTADVECDKAIVDRIRKHFPDHQFMTEEQFSDLKAIEHVKKPLWVIDPIDGTVNYVYGIAQVAISIAFFAEGHVQVGVVGAPFLNEEFTAIRGQGAFCNGEKIQCRDTTTVKSALVATGFPYARVDLPKLLARFTAAVENCRDVRRMGAAALDLCFVACGRLDAYYETVKPWDMAAGLLVAREAGATAGHIASTNVNTALPEDLNADDLLVATPKIFVELKKLLADAPS